MSWLTGVLLNFFYRTLIPDFIAWVMKQIHKVTRKREQKGAIEEIEKDVSGSKLRNEETRKHEETYLNS